MPEIKNLYIYINLTSLNISYTPININNLNNYAYLELKTNNNFTDIYNIKITYKNDSDTLTILEDKINLRSILSIYGSTLLESLQLDYVTRDIEFLENVFYNSPYPGQLSPTSLQKYINTFVGTMCLTYFTFIYITSIKNYKIYSNDSLIPKIKITDLSQNLYKYISYIYDYINITDDNNKIIIFCLNEIKLRWSYFNNIIIPGPKYDDIKSHYIALHGYANYIKSQSLQFDELNKKLDSKYTTLNNTIDDKSKKSNSDVNNIIISTLSITTNVLETINSKSEELQTELYNIKTNCSIELLEETTIYKKELNKFMDSTLEDNIDSKINVLYEKYKNKLNQSYNDICTNMITTITEKIYSSVEKKIDDYINDRIYSTNIGNIVEEYLKLKNIE